MSADNLTIAILGKDISCHRESLPIDELYFLPDNPRVYNKISKISGFNQLSMDEKRDLIYDIMLDEASVKNLEPEIKRDGGLHDPIIVRCDTNEVIDGNSRLAVYRKFRDDCQHEKWNRIDCVIVSNLTDEQQTRLLSQAHLKGPTEWSPYAKALFCYRQVVEQKVTRTELHETSGISVKEISACVNIINLMNENKDEEESHYSYYEVLIKKPKISSSIKEKPNLKNKLLREIKANTNNGFTSQKMRDQLPYVIDKPKVLTNFINGKIDLEEAYDRAKITDTQKKLKTILGRLDEIEQRSFEQLGRNDLRAVEQIVKKIRRKICRVDAMVKKQIETSRNDSSGQVSQ